LDIENKLLIFKTCKASLKIKIKQLFRTPTNCICGSAFQPLKHPRNTVNKQSISGLK